MTTLEKAPVETEETTDRPPLLHCFCAYCINMQEKVKALCGFIEHDTENWEDHSDDPGEKCVVCLEMQWIPCPVCGG